jgi:hypothetical protein
MRQKIFDGDRASINIYLSAKQKALLLRVAKEAGISPSAVIRKLLGEL